MRDPRQALTIVALAFAAHAVLDVAHRPGVLPEGVAPRWYSVGCAVFNVYIGAVAYWPMLGAETTFRAQADGLVSRASRAEFFGAAAHR